MSELIVVSFLDKSRADEVMLDLLKQDSASLADLEDAVVVTKNSQGQIRVKPYYDLIAESKEGRKNEFWGTLLTTLINEGSKEALSQIGIDAQFCEKVERSLSPNSSAIIVLCRKVDPEQLAEDLKQYEGTVIKTRLLGNNEAELYDSLTK